MNSPALLVIPLLVLVLVTSCQAQTETDIFARSLVSMGNTARLQHVLAKARRGEPVVITVIGGSITQGARASDEAHRWGSVVATWWSDTFPAAKVTHINAGIGATGSVIAAHRAQEHLLKHKPDLVAVEFGVNDPNDKFAAETLEGLARQILKLPNEPAVMLLFLTNNAGGNAQEWHSKIGEHYGLPMVSFRDAIWPEIAAKRMKWEDVEGDEIHPNDRGHKYCGDFVNAVVKAVYDKLPADADLPPIPPTPAPLISDVFERATFFNADTITPTRNEGFKPAEAYPFGKCWEAEAPGASLEFEVSGTAISVCFFRIKKDTGMAEAQVDDKPAEKLNAWFNADWGGYSAWQMVARDLAPGKHTLRIKVLEEKDPGSTGHRFQLQTVMAAGL